ncbi:MAG TPA: zinc ribbon domain-containing protein [Candidatus Acidoferrales bacterium]|nr:zinc ribbon domain-containing protein [Candidatus Acidoferrales bacterium]
MSYCPTCGKSVDKDAKSGTALCTTCGTAVQLPTKSVGAPSFTRIPERKELGANYCIRCGLRIPEHAKYCSTCSQTRANEIPSIY